MEHNNIYRSVFKVTHSGGSGSCFYLKNYDLFVTNYHVVEGYRTVAVHDNDRNPYLAKVVLVNPALDIALLAAEGDFSALPEMTLAADDSLTIGRKVYVAGYPYGMPFTITEGSVSSPKQLMDGKYYIQTDAAVNPGNSGGPILNDAEEVVGVTVSKFTQADNMGFGIRVETLHGLLESLGELDRTAFQVQCGSCEELICEEEEFCPSCGDKLPEGVFDERELSPLGGFGTLLWERPGLTAQMARDRLASYDFLGEEVFKLVADLSGGERARLKHCLLSFEPINLFLLDEPTNHLDIPSREWVESVLEEYEGTLLFISHDRYFISRMASRILTVEQGTVHDFRGDFEAYQQAREARRQTAAPAAPKAPAKEAAEAKAPADGGRALSPLRQERTLQRRQAACEKEIAALEQQLLQLKEEMERSMSDYETLFELTQRQAALETQLEELYEQWSGFAEQLEALESEKEKEKEQ